MKCTKYGCGYKGKAKTYEEKYDLCPKCENIQLKEEHKDYKLILELSPEQASVIRNALDSYSRMLMGQLDYALDPIRWQNYELAEKGIAPKADWYEEVVPLLTELKQKLFGLPSNSNYGIFNTQISEDARVSWDIHQVIRNKLAWTEHPKGDYTVVFDKPLKSAKVELPKAEIIF